LLLAETILLAAACSGHSSSRIAWRTVRSLSTHREKDRDAASSARIVYDVIPPRLPATIALRNGC